MIIYTCSSRMRSARNMPRLIYVCMYVYTYICMYVCMCVYTYACMNVCIHVHLCMYTHTYTPMHVHTYMLRPNQSNHYFYDVNPS
jgi:hypothetical protein